MKKKLLAIMALAAGSMFAQTRFSIGVNIGGGYSPAYYAPAYVAPVLPCPGPGYSWIAGYYSDAGYGRRAWVPGYWRAPVVHYGYGAPRFDYRRDERRDFRGNQYGHGIRVR